MTGSVHDASAVALGVFMALGAVDGLYLHLWKLSLHNRPASRREHRFHTAAALLFLLTLPALFLWETGGLLLWAGLGLVAADLVVALFDMLSEKDSRAGLGGLSTGEYVLHMAVTSARGVAVALALAARPAEAWALTAAWIQAPLPAFAASVAWQAVPGTIAVALLHLWLCTSRGAQAFDTLRHAVRTRWRARPPACRPLSDPPQRSVLTVTVQTGPRRWRAPREGASCSVVGGESPEGGHQPRWRYKLARRRNLLPPEAGGFQGGAAQPPLAHNVGNLARISRMASPNSGVVVIPFRQAKPRSIRL